MMQRTWATHFDVVGTVEHGREDGLGDLHGDRDPVSVCPAVFGLHAFDRVLVVSLEGAGFTAARICFCKFSSSSEGRTLLTWSVAFPTGVISCFSADSSAAASLCQAMTTEASAGDHWTSGRASGSDSPWPVSFAADASTHRSVTTSRAAVLVDGSCDHHGDSSQSSEMTTKMKVVLHCVTLPAPRFTRKSHQIFPYSRLVRHK